MSPFQGFGILIDTITQGSTLGYRIPPFQGLNKTCTVALCATVHECVSIVHGAMRTAGSQLSSCGVRRRHRRSHHRRRRCGLRGGELR